MEAARIYSSHVKRGICFAGRIAEMFLEYVKYYRWGGEWDE